MNKRLVWILAAGALLAACQGVPMHAAEQPASTATAGGPVTGLPNVPLTPDVLYYLLLGEIAGHRGQMDVSVDALSRAAARTRDPRLAERATLTALYARRPQEALSNARLWAELRPQSIEAHEALGAASLELGDLEGARKEFEALLSTGDEKTQAAGYLRIAATLARQTDRTRALDLMRTLVTLHPEQSVAHYALAHLAVRVSDLDTAMTAIDRALALNPSWEDAALFKARILVSQQDATRNLRFHEQYLDAYPHAQNMRLGYARLLVDLKQWDKARAQFRRLAAANPKDADVTFTLALLALQMNDLDEAETWLQRTLDAQPENDQARLHLGQLAEQRKQYEEAMRWYGEIDAPELFFEAQVRIGIVLAKQGHVEEARSHLHNLQPANDAQRTQIVLAEEQILREAKRFPVAYDILSSALRHLPDNIDLLYARALVAEKLDRLDTAEKDLRHILKKEPKNSQALNALGYTLADRTVRYAEALALIERALAEKPDDPFILDSMGWVQYRLGKHAEALRYLRTAIDKRADAEIAAHLGEVLWVTGDRAGAESVWLRALKQTPDNEALLGVINKFKEK